MSISSRIHDTIEAWVVEWRDRLRGWMSSWVEIGAERLMDAMEPELRAEIKPSLLRLREIPGMPDDFKDLIDKTLAEPGFIHFAAILPYLVGIMIGFGMGAAAPASRIASFQVENLVHSHRLDAMSVITAWRRDPEAYEHLFQDLKDQGWTEERIEALKFLTLFIPTADEQTLWLAREVFEPEMVTKYGLDDELPVYGETDFSKVGVDPEQMKNKWRAHWEHASWMQVVEMLHRGLLTEADVWEWFRLVEIPPFWRQLLIDTAYTWPTRVDVRRWWDMRTIDEPELRRLYSGMGYRGVNLDNYVIWTKVYVAFPDLMARWSKGWITIDEVRAELTALGMPAERLEEFIQMKVKAEQPERTATERDVTKTDIIKGVRQGVITRGEGVEFLQDLGYDYDEAVYILEINIPVDQEEVVVAARKISKADILKGLKAEVITSTEALTKLMELRYSSSDAALLLKIYEDQVEPPVEPKQREASKADIVLGVTKGLIDQYEGYMMLLDLDFTPEAADFILMVKTEESPFSPINYQEFKDLTHKYRLAIGREARPMTEELKTAADEVVKLTGEVEALERSVAAEKRKLIKDEVVPEAATKKLTALETKLHRAQSELARVKTEYNIQLAEWRHG